LTFRWRSALLWRTFFTAAVVAVVLRVFMVFCRSGKCGLFGEGGLIMFDVNSAKPTYSIPDLLAVIFLGVIGGIFGSLYNYLVDKVLRTYSIINEYALEIPFIFISIPMGYICLSTIFDITHNTTTYVCVTQLYVYIT
jgi:H+/Cl- antiporter ClcA